jgi:hypothetical protein
MTSKELKQLNKAYTRSFANLRKSFFMDKKSGLKLFAEYLKYLRDFIILTNYDNKSDAHRVKIATIIAASAELDEYNKTQDTFHWNNFCELIKQNMEDWLSINDSV